tara:strand:+ start:175 stop:336 length:162 start_codon:yes stop_codon:yes gene_type:complete
MYGQQPGMVPMGAPGAMGSYGAYPQQQAYGQQTDPNAAMMQGGYGSNSLFSFL